MSRPPPDPPSPDAKEPAARSAAQRSRVGTAWVGGYFDPAVVRALKSLALKDNTTVQSLIGRALNDLLEQAGLGRPASQAVLPRAGAAHRREDDRSS